ncbi:MAG: phosphoglucosamine mutase [Myxococcales bacterium FL481]|nr:MAG: phosphoglucosamine mutase [Myxococcales bacterium FL481]
MTATRKLFGTDGIRGKANVFPMTPETAMRVGAAVAGHFGKHGRVVVGKDTRRSGYMFETALASGLTAMGADVMLVGPLPTPGIAYITHSMRADAGVVISASHNPFEDNGIKLFASDGYKLPDHAEAHLEALMERSLEATAVTGDAIGKALRIDDAAGRYITYIKQSFPSELSLDGLRIVVDAAHGACYRIAPAVLSELGATVIPTGVSPNGTNINAGVGALHPEHIGALVRQHGADIGIALDGDADRVVFADANGDVVDGDAVMAICALDMAAHGQLAGNALVTTVMSNMGLGRALEAEGIELVRTPVGDRYVVETMRSRGCNLGGEQSGHLIFLDHATTGDGMVAALRVLQVMLRRQTGLSDLAAVMQRYPQVLRAVQVMRKPPLDQLPRLSQAIAEAETELGRDGRTLVRYSGTEPKLRVMVEGGDTQAIKAICERLCAVAEEELGTA